jgi:hypothetical protein
VLKNKLFEVRDEGTCVPVLAIEMKVPEEDGGDRFCLQRSGYGSGAPWCILLVNLNTNKAEFDCYEWFNSRTMKHAHNFIERNWEELESGQVVDVRVILGETEIPVKSDRFYL